MSRTDKEGGAPTLINPAGLYKSILKVQTEPRQATVRGKIPQWVHGSLLRNNGPGLYEAGKQEVDSIYDGFALLHRFIIKDGTVFYQSRYLESDAYELAMSEQRLVLTGFGTAVHRDPCKSYLRHIFSYFQKPMPDVTDNCNISWLRLGQDQFYTMTETNFIHRVDPKTLKSLGKIDITKYVAVNSATAHPHFEQGVAYNMGSSYGRQTNYNIIKIPLHQEKGKETKQAEKASSGETIPLETASGEEANPFERASILCSIPSTTFYPAYYHSFGITRNYIVFLEQPLVTNVLKMAFSKLLEVAPAASLEYHPERKCRFFLVNLHTGEVLATKYLTEAFFCFHFINSYEEDGHVVVDLCRHLDTNIIKNATLEHFRANGPQGPGDSNCLRPVRFVLPLELNKEKENLVTLAGTQATAKLTAPDTVLCTHEVLCEEAVEGPRINYKFHNGRPYRYFYGVITCKRQIMKADCKSKTVAGTWECEDGDYYPSEPVFIPNPDGKDEDDGVVLSLVVTSSGPAKHPFLLVVDARTFTEIARAEVDCEMPFAFHGLFINHLVD